MGNKISHRRRPAVDERYTRPQGLYPCRDVDQRKLRRLILDSKLAPCVPGQEDPNATDLEECPICFLHYPTLNRSKCCVKGICTECFLQLKPPHARATQCPFCKAPGYAVEYRGAKTLEEKGLEQAEEQKVIEAKIRMRQQEAQEDEDRAKRRKEDQRLGRSVRSHHPRSITPVEEDYEDLTWNSEEDLIWNSAPSQDLRFGSELTFSERTTSGMHPYQRAAPFQQSAVSVASNFMNHQQHEQQQTEIEFRSPARFPQRREDEFDLDLEDIMVMEAIWLSIQEQGARHRFTDIVEEGSEIIEADVGLAGAIAAMVERQAVNHQRTVPTINHPVEEEEAAHDEEQPTTGESTTTATITTESTPTQDPSETSSSSSSSATGAADEEQSKRFDDACEISSASNEDKVVLPEQMTLVMPKPVQ